MSFPHIDREALVVIGYCHHTRKMFGIRTERLDSRRWVQDWAFPIEPSVASAERFDRNRISGEIIIDSSYPGCPYCGATGWFKCDKCGSLVCHEDEDKAICPKCGMKYDGFINSTEFDLKGGTH